MATASEDSDFDCWLSQKFQALNTDDSVIVPYVKSILEGEEEDESEKHEALVGILSEISVDDVEGLCQELILRWNAFVNIGGSSEHPPDTSVQSSVPSHLEDRIAQIMIQKADESVKVKVPLSNGSSEVKQAILSQYSEVCDVETDDEEEDDHDSSHGAKNSAVGGHPKGSKHQDKLPMSDQLVPPVNVTNDLEETLLRAARSDDLETLQELLNSRSSEKIQLNINCKGTRGWTALHLASYFGNKSVIELLLENGADPNVVNDDGDTPLHKAALTSRFEVLEILLRSDANVCAINGEGKSAEDLATNRDAKDLLEQSRKAAEEIREGVFLAACKDGFLSRIEEMLECVPKVNINCVDRLGNTALHSAAYLDNRAVAICLLEHGIDTTIRNHHGHLASDMALNSSMKEMLGVPPIKSLSQTPFRYQGPLFKHQRFRGWKPFWVILDRGVLSYYKTPGNAAANFRRRFHKHLNSAVVLKAPEDLGMFVIRFPDGDQHRLSLTPHCTQRAIERQKWIAVIGEHVTFSSRMLSATVEEDDADDDTESLLSADFATVGRMKKNVSFVYSDPQTSTHVKSLRSMKDALQTAEAYKELLAQDSEMLSNSFNQLPITYRQGALYSLLLKVDTVQRTAKDVVESLNYCLNLFRQQEDLRVLELKRSKEKCRVLEESLLVLAKQHRNLELSLSTGVSHEIGAHPFSAELGGGSEKRIRKKKPNLRKPVVGWIETETCGSDGELVDCTGIDRHLNSSDSEYNTPYGSMSDLRASAPSPMIHVGVTRTRIAVLGAAEDEAVMTMIEERSEYGR
ncbi:unnamed protein product [Notodromas monacha]|uniref:PH domain-containing protein n=1 Tax=Notodromas monacha TaxID=399045 RepID=A0A7R9GDN5_9CRUS|nr:unnamed protein product [Notodromas monacha]CAG0917403.1 unnamed protein product [Notodromas monacha]